jgi:hypothetical protein
MGKLGLEVRATGATTIYHRVLEAKLEIYRSGAKEAVKGHVCTIWDTSSVINKLV